MNNQFDVDNQPKSTFWLPIFAIILMVLILGFCTISTLFGMHVDYGASIEAKFQTSFKYSKACIGSNFGIMRQLCETDGSAYSSMTGSKSKDFYSIIYSVKYGSSPPDIFNMNDSLYLYFTINDKSFRSKTKIKGCNKYTKYDFGSLDTSDIEEFQQDHSVTISNY